MKRILDWIKTMSLIMLGVIAGCAVLTFVVAKTLWFPNVAMYSDAKAGVEINSYTYSSWLWNKEEITKINIFDRKNDGPNFEIILNGPVNNLRLMHSGEDFAIISARASEWAYNDKIYILHRVPKAEGKEGLEYKDVSGNIFAVAPDERSYFYIIPSLEHPATIIRRDWQDNDLAKVDIPKDYGLSLENPIFFSNQNKLALGISKLDDYRRNVDSSLIIWHLPDNTTSTISITKLFPNYLEGKLFAEDYGAGDLYLKKEYMSVRKIKIAE